jgi:hypothetical protein
MQQRLRNASNNAWEELLSFKNDVPQNPSAEQEKELERLTKIATDASYELNAHVNACSECKQK